MDHDAEFEGLQPIEDRIRELAPELGYLVVQDRTQRGQDDPVGRYDFPDTPDSEASNPWGHPSGASPTDGAEAAVQWVRHTAIRHTLGDTWRRFRVKLHGPKGMRLLDSGHFVCRLSAPPPPPDGLSTSLTPEDGAVPGMTALGHYYAQWGQLLLGSAQQLQEIHKGLLGQLHSQLQASREQIDQLVGGILEFRVKALETEEGQRDHQRDREARNALAQTALQQIGQAAQAFLAHQSSTEAHGLSIPPGIATALHHPELHQALHDPAVQSLMRDPVQLTQLATLLRSVAAQASAPTPVHDSHPTDGGTHASSS